VKELLGSWVLLAQCRSIVVFRHGEPPLDLQILFRDERVARVVRHTILAKPFLNARKKQNDVLYGNGGIRMRLKVIGPVVKRNARHGRLEKEPLVKPERMLVSDGPLKT